MSLKTKGCEKCWYILYDSFMVNVNSFLKGMPKSIRNTRRSQGKWV